MLINDKVIVKAMEEHRVEGEEFGYYFYGQTMSIGKMLLAGHFSYMLEKQCFVQFTNKKVDIVTLNKITAKPERYNGVPLTDIKRIKLDGGMFGKTMNLEFKDGEHLKLRIFKSLAIKKQKENLVNIENFLKTIGLMA
ncbi:PH domain-containing protein [Vallitalea okinawensis]|uniref:PH domain-containing protein n=1 Tax=Vallitalea okinawensis TaxID=2078660 RepID=UPI000CFD0245|nr:PH domain-containing protein [Vallitalea okinawensis]